MGVGGGEGDFQGSRSQLWAACSGQVDTERDLGLPTAVPQAPMSEQDKV